MEKENKKPISTSGSKNSGKAEKVTVNETVRPKGVSNETYLNLLKQHLKFTTKDEGFVSVQVEGLPGDVLYLRDRNRYYLSSASKLIEKGKAVKIYTMEELKANVKQVTEAIKKKLKEGN